MRVSVQDHEHVLLLIEMRDGKPVKEPVHAKRLANGNMLLLHSPGFVEGIAAGDEFRMVDGGGTFEVVRRGGNLVVQVYSTRPVEGMKDRVTAQVAKLSGVLDGAIERGMVFTIPLSAGFEAIERVFNEFVASEPGTEWYYGNVYDRVDKETPLNWWKDPSQASGCLVDRAQGAESAGEGFQ